MRNMASQLPLYPYPPPAAPPLPTHQYQPYGYASYGQQPPSGPYSYNNHPPVYYNGGNHYQPQAPPAPPPPPLTRRHRPEKVVQHQTPDGGGVMPNVATGTPSAKSVSQPPKERPQKTPKEQLPALTRGQQSRVKELLRELRKDYPHLKISEALLRERVLDAAARGMSLATVTAAAFIDNNNASTMNGATVHQATSATAPQTGATGTVLAKEAILSPAHALLQAPDATEQSQSEGTAHDNNNNAPAGAPITSTSGKVASALIPAAAVAADVSVANGASVNLDVPLFKEVAKNRREHRGGLSKRRWLRRQMELQQTAATEAEAGEDNGDRQKDPGDEKQQYQIPTDSLHHQTESANSQLTPNAQPFVLPTLPTYEQTTKGSEGSNASGQLVRYPCNTLCSPQQSNQALKAASQNVICIQKEVLRSAPPLVYHYQPLQTTGGAAGSASTGSENGVVISPQSRNLSPSAAAALAHRSPSPGQLLPSSLNPACVPWVPPSVAASDPKSNAIPPAAPTTHVNGEAESIDRLKNLLEQLLPTGTDLNVTPSSYLDLDAEHSLHRLVPQVHRDKVEDYKQLVMDARMGDEEDEDSSDEDSGVFPHIKGGGGYNINNFAFPTRGGAAAEGAFNNKDYPTARPQGCNASSSGESSEYEVVLRKKPKSGKASGAIQKSATVTEAPVTKVSPTESQPPNTTTSISLVVGSPVDSIPQRLPTANYDTISLSSFISGHVSDEGDELLRQSSVQAVVGKAGSVRSSLLSKPQSHSKKHAKYSKKSRRQLGSGSLSAVASVATSSSVSSSGASSDSASSYSDEAHDSDSYAAVGHSNAEDCDDEEIENCPRLKNKKRKGAYGAGPCRTRMIMTAAALRDTFNAIASDKGVMIRLNRDGGNFYADSVSLTALAKDRMMRYLALGSMSGSSHNGQFQHPLLIKDRPQVAAEQAVMGNTMIEGDAPIAGASPLDSFSDTLPAVSTTSHQNSPICEGMSPSPNKDKALTTVISCPTGARDEALLAKAIVTLREGLAAKQGRGGGNNKSSLTSKALEALSSGKVNINDDSSEDSGAPRAHGYSQVMRWKLQDQFELVVGSDLPVVGVAPVTYDRLVMSAHSIDSLATAPSQHDPRLDDLANIPTANIYNNTISYENIAGGEPISCRSMNAPSPTVSYPDLEDPSAIVGEPTNMLLAIHSVDTKLPPPPPRQLLPPPPSHHPSTSPAAASSHTNSSINTYSWAHHAPPEGFAATKQAPFASATLRTAQATSISSANSNKPSYTLSRSEALEYWFDALVANVNYVGIVLHQEGVVRNVDIVNSADLLARVPGGLRLAQDSMQGMQKVLRWLINGSKGDGEYVLFRKDGDSDFELYEIPKTATTQQAIASDGGVGVTNNLTATLSQKKFTESGGGMADSFDTETTFGNTVSGATPLSAAVRGDSATFAANSCSKSNASHSQHLPMTRATTSCGTHSDERGTITPTRQRSATTTTTTESEKGDRTSREGSNANIGCDLLQNPSATMASSSADGRSCSTATTATPTVANSTTNASACSAARPPTVSSGKSSNISAHLCSFLLKHGDINPSETGHPEHFANISASAIGLDCNDKLIVVGDVAHPATMPSNELYSDGVSAATAITHNNTPSPLKPSAVCACEKAKQQRQAIIKEAEEEQKKKDEADAKAKLKARDEELRARRAAQKDVLRM